MTYSDKRIASVLVHWLTHSRGQCPPCNCLEELLARNAARKVPFAETDIRRLYPAACVLVDNAERVQDACERIRKLRAEGKPIPPELNVKLCDLPGVKRPE